MIEEKGKRARKEETARAAFPCIDVERSEETKVEIDRDVAGDVFTVAK